MRYHHISFSGDQLSRHLTQWHSYPLRHAAQWNALGSAHISARAVCARADAQHSSCAFATAACARTRSSVTHLSHSLTPRLNQIVRHHAGTTVRPRGPRINQARRAGLSLLPLYLSPGIMCASLKARLPSASFSTDRMARPPSL